MRGGRTRDGFQVYNPEDTPGDKASKIMAHLVRSTDAFLMESIKKIRSIY
jgi:hypothetical protein